ncbi:hypothetical protein LI012_16875 [Caldibacillus thermoamylovorans]|uniref:group II intron maturase-specific domain-containing protein n=1 Tax=Caldibacillus thermoamylovorans TaxID=35841 RepID=UPI001D0740A8|nr:hypothetical protein [Caldibacillus thermoamylovorans]
MDTSKSAKQRFKEKLRKVTSRKHLVGFKEIITKINQIITGWINFLRSSRCHRKISLKPSSIVKITWRWFT